jgi:hypothetical protein
MQVSICVIEYCKIGEIGTIAVSKVIQFVFVLACVLGWFGGDGCVGPSKCSSYLTNRVWCLPCYITNVESRN